MIAVIRTGGKQYTVSEKQVLRIEKLSDASRKDGKVVFDDVLAVADGEKKVNIGTPHVAGARVEATILRDAKAKKVLVVKYKPKVRYRKTRGHRQLFTEIRIDSIIIK